MFMVSWKFLHLLYFIQTKPNGLKSQGTILSCLICNCLCMKNNYLWLKNKRAATEATLDDYTWIRLLSYISGVYPVGAQLKR